MEGTKAELIEFMKKAKGRKDGEKMENRGFGVDHMDRRRKKKVRHCKEVR